MFVLDLIGTAVFAYAGAAIAHGRGFNLLSVYVLGMTTAVGGGTLRELILQSPGLFWIDSIEYLLVGGVAVGAGSLSSFRVKTHLSTFRILDLFSTAIFVTIGLNTCIELGTAPHIAIIMGVLTGVGGGILRDILTGRTPQAFTDRIMALALLGACCGVYLAGASEYSPWVGVFASMATIELLYLYMHKNISVAV